jgi:hypothetical protein
MGNHWQQEHEGVAPADRHRGTPRLPDRPQVRILPWAPEPLTSAYPSAVGRRGPRRLAGAPPTPTSWEGGAKVHATVGHPRTTPASKQTTALPAGNTAPAHHVAELITSSPTGGPTPLPLNRTSCSA